MNTIETIINQLGAGKFIATTGAHFMARGQKTLIARFKGSKIANHMEITLNENDLYNVTFMKVAKNVKDVFNGVDYSAEMLCPLFESITKLRTSL